MSTAQDAMTAVATESPEAAGLLALVMEHNAAMAVNMLPTWEVVDHEKAQAFDQGYSLGYREALAEVEERMFAGLHPDPKSHPYRPRPVAVTP